MKKIIKDRNAILILLGKSVSLIGTEMQDFALALYVLNLTGSATKFASVIAIAMIPKLLLGPFTGVVSDWMDRKKIIVSMDFLSGITIGISLIIYLNQGELSLLFIYGLALVLSIISTIFQPAMMSLVPSVIKKERYVEFNSLLSGSQTICMIISPLLAGILMSTFGLVTIFLINSVSFIISGITECFIEYKHKKDEDKKMNSVTFFNDFKEGIVFLKNNDLIWSIMILSSVSNFALNPVFGIGIPVIVKSVLKLDDSMYGVMNSIVVVGMIIGPIVAPYATGKISLKKMVIITNIIITGLLVLLGIAPKLYSTSVINEPLIVFIATAVITILVLIVIVVNNIAVTSLLQKEIPNEYLGRCMAAYQTTVTGMVPLGQMFYGVMFDKLDVFTTVIIASLFLLTSTLVLRKNFMSKNETMSLAHE